LQCNPQPQHGWPHSQTSSILTIGNLADSQTKRFIHWDALWCLRIFNQNFVSISPLFCSVIIRFDRYQNMQDTSCIGIYLEKKKRSSRFIWGTLAGYCFVVSKYVDMFVGLLFGWWLVSCLILYLDSCLWVGWCVGLLASWLLYYLAVKLVVWLSLLVFQRADETATNTMVKNISLKLLCLYTSYTFTS
jgi:hypothetical protein